jgi:predicted phosphoribosyltransferase
MPSSPSYLFKDRKDAAHQLAQRLAQLRLHHPLILAIPRGAIPIGAVLARKLQGELDVVLVRKLPSPFDPEYAIGAIDERGNRLVGADYPMTDASRAWLDRVATEQLAVLHQRRADYSGSRPPADPCGRHVVIVDDGLATGATMVAALRAVRAALPLELIAAVPVAAPQSLRHVAALADRVVCLHAPANFAAVSQQYKHFPQVEQAEAVKLLRQCFALQTAVSQND